ncbi:hypothetical protein Bbelb_354640 [Branchiostoma belcheri]|nr:hypothetical protein Bbelb_354640 [Branchiostoma belcheri]
MESTIGSMGLLLSCLAILLSFSFLWQVKDTTIVILRPPRYLGFPMCSLYAETEISRFSGIPYMDASLSRVSREHGSNFFTRADRRQASGGDKPHIQPEVDDGTGRGGANGHRRTRRRRRGDREEAAGGVEVRVQQTGVRQRRPLKPPTWQQPFSVTAEENMRTEQQSNSLNLLKFELTSVPARLKSGGLPSVRAAPARVDRAAGHPLSTPARCWPGLPAFYARALLQIGRATRAPRPAAWSPKIAIARAASGFRGLPYLEAHMTCTDGVFDEREDGVYFDMFRRRYQWLAAIVSSARRRQDRRRLQEGVYYVVVDQLGRQFSTQESL